MMQRYATLSVKGTRFYQAAQMLAARKLVAGCDIELRHEPNNPYDKNAVAVILKTTGAQLGHIPKEKAAKYAFLVQKSNSVEAKVERVDKLNEDIFITISIKYITSDDQAESIDKSQLIISASTLPSCPGVYEIKNVKTARSYIGSAENVRSRMRQHITMLLDRSHNNNLLQADFCAYGVDSFRAVLLEECAASEIRIREARHIDSSLRSLKSLYNKTSDGKGRNRGSSSQLSISDKMYAYYKAEEIRKKKQEFEIKRIEPLIQQADAIEYKIIANKAGIIGGFFKKTVDYNMEFAKYGSMSSYTLLDRPDVRFLISQHAGLISEIKDLKRQRDEIS